MAFRPLWLVLPVALMAACSSSSDDVDDLTDDLTEASNGPAISDGSETEVWSVQNQWADTDTRAANEAGIAWRANSGLSWEDKYAAWFSSLEKIPSTEAKGSTIQITTPYGKKIPIASLECAELAMALRAVFASWYHLPFFMTGWDDKNHRPLYAGHMGFVDGTGVGINGFPRFKAQYKDFEPNFRAESAWPKDTGLRAVHLGSDDRVSFLEQGAGAGAWLDEIVLNKRVGYFLRLFLTFFGTINLADSANLFNIAPESIKAGDVLVERFRKTGVGHTIQLFRVEVIEGKLAPSVATAAMPRRQALWADPIDARSFFLSPHTGGPGNSDDGTPLAALGGGIHRWRAAVSKGGRWSNIVPAVDQSAFVSAKDLNRIAERLKTFGDVLAFGAPEDLRDAALNIIAEARQHLQSSPASCGARGRREDGFSMLYKALGILANKSTHDVDQQYRKLEDYVFADLDYAKSKTCCWDTTTPAMAEIILDQAQREIDAGHASKQCVMPTIFMARKNAGDGYQYWQKHASAMGRAGDWRTWSQDEPCDQAGVAEDTAAAREGNAYCSVFGP